MQHRSALPTWTWTLAALGACVLSCATTPLTGEPESAYTSPHRGAVQALYAAWKGERARTGTERLLEIPLGFAKGVSVDSNQRGGRFQLDRDTGRMNVELYGMSDDADVWLVDNRPGEGTSSLPDREDAVMRLGTVRNIDGRARLEAVAQDMGREGFEIDRVVVCKPGLGPTGGVLLMGSASVFDRLYEQERGSMRALVRGDLGEAMDPDAALDELVKRGAFLFERETFAGNGRTCATCHPALNNFTIDPPFIASLADDDPLFVAEQVPALAALENPELMRSRGLILENLDGFDRPGVMRGVPPTLALATSITGPAVPFDNTSNPTFGVVPPAQRTGWSGDGSPGAGTLREFAIGAVIQHFPQSLDRREGVDFRLPTDAELDALEAFQLSLGRSQDIDLASLRFRDPVVREGREIFNRSDSQQGRVAAGKCGLCHSQAGANIDSEFFGNVLGFPVSGNANFGTGVNDLRRLPADLIDFDGNPRDGGFARVPHDGQNCQPARGGFGTVTPPGGALPPGLCEEDFNTPPLVEAADTAPFFHNNAVDTLEAAVAFYNSDAFNESAGGQLLTQLDSGKAGIDLDATEVSAVANMLRVVNALENIREASALAADARDRYRGTAVERLERAAAEVRDALQVLKATGLHPEATQLLRQAKHTAMRARGAFFGHSRRRHVDRTLELLEQARGQLIEL